MTNIPKYVPTTKLQPAVSTPDTSFDKWSKEFTHISNQILNVQQQDANADALERAKEEGASPDFKEKTPITRTDRIYERRALQANQITLADNVREHALDLRSELTKPGRLNANSGNVFRSEMNDYLDTVIANAPEANKNYIKNMGTAFISSIGSTIDRQSNVLAKSQQRFSLYDFVDGQMQEASRMAFEGDAQGAIKAAGYFGQIQQKVQNAVMSGYLPPEAGESIIKNARTKLQSLAVLGKYKSDLMQGNGQESMMEFIKNPPPDMDLATYRSTLSQMQGLQNAVESAQKVNDSIMQQDINSTFAQVATGDLPPESSEVAEAYNNTVKSRGQEGADWFAGKLASANNTNSLRQATRFISPLEAQKATNIMLSKLDPNDPEYQKKAQYIRKAQDASLRNWHEFSGDPYTYVQEHPAVLQSMSATRSSPQEGNGGITQGGVFINSDPYEASVQAQLQLGAQMNPVAPGIPQVSVMGKDAAKNMAQVINGLPLDRQLVALKEIEKQYGKNAPIAFRDLQKAGVPIANMWFNLLANTNPAKQLDAMNALMMPKDATKNIPHKDMNLLTSAVSSQMRDYSSSVNNNYATPSWQSYQQSYDTVLGLAKYYLVSGKAGDPQTAAQMAYDAYIPSAMKFTSLDGRGTVRLPPDINTASLKEAANISFMENIKNGAEFSTRDNRDALAYLLQIKNQGKWVTLPDNSGIVLTDGLGAPVIIKKDGQVMPIKVLYDDLRNPQSKINQKIAANFPSSYEQAKKAGNTDQFTAVSANLAQWGKGL